MVGLYPYRTFSLRSSRILFLVKYHSALIGSTIACRLWFWTEVDFFIHYNTILYNATCFEQSQATGTNIRVSLRLNFLHVLRSHPVLGDLGSRLIYSRPRASMFWPRGQWVALETEMRLAVPVTSYASNSDWFIALCCDTPDPETITQDVITSSF